MKSYPKIILKAATAEVGKNIPVAYKQNVPIAREYIRSKEVQQLAVEKYHKNGKGITFNDLLLSGISKTKIQAQLKLKNCLKNQVLFTLQDHKPQQYYPTSIKAHILERKNVPLDPTGVCYQYYYHPYNNSFIADILPLLPAAPSYIHNMHFRLKVSPECYVQLSLPAYNINNKGKHQYENLAN